MSFLSGRGSRSSSRSSTRSDTISTATPPTASQSSRYSTSSSWTELEVSFDLSINLVTTTFKKEVSAKEDENDDSSLCESDSDVTTSDTISAIERNAHWKERDFCHDFSDPQIDHDRILLVGGKDLHVISNILMETSDFFKILFGENFKESGQEKIELKDVVTEDFIEFLNHLYSNNRKITKDNFFTLYTLADRYLTPLIFKKCNDFIKEDPEMINDFGQRTFDLLQMAVDMDLKDITKVLQKKVFTTSRIVLCKKCERQGKKHKRHYGLYLANDHICMQHRDYILTLNPKMITFILNSLIHCEEPRKYNTDTDEESVKSMDNTKRELASEKLLIYNFANKGPYHDSTILVKNLRKDTEQIFNVDSKIVCSGAKWFRGRLEKGSQLILTDVLAAHFEIFLNFIYPNAHPILFEFSMALLEMSVRFDSPCLYQKVFDELSNGKEKKDQFLKEMSDETVELIEIAMKYDLREKLLYKHVIQPYANMTETDKNCPATDKFKKHKFKPDGVFNSLYGIIFLCDVCRESADVQRFLLSCILKNVSKCI